MSWDMKKRKNRSTHFSLKKVHVHQILKKFKRCKVLVFGDVGLDQYTMGHVSRISPEAPIPILEVTETHFKLGLASNVADNIVSLGGHPVLVGLIGKDRTASDFLRLLKTRKINPRYLVSDPQRKTVLKERIIAETQQVVRIDHETKQDLNPKILSRIWEKLSLALRNVDGVIIEDYAKGLVQAMVCQKLIESAEKKGIPVFVDPNRKSPLHLYYGCTVITPNISEAEVLSGIQITDTKSLQRAGLYLLEQLNAKLVVITRGKEGMALFIPEKTNPILIPTFAREVFDVSGAGDTTIATLSLALLSGADMVEASLLANYAAGVEVGKWGTATVSTQELKEYIDFVGEHHKHVY